MKHLNNFFEENEDILIQLKDVNISYLEKIIEKLEIHFYKLNIAELIKNFWILYLIISITISINI